MSDSTATPEPGTVEAWMIKHELIDSGAVDDYESEVLRAKAREIDQQITDLTARLKAAEEREHALADALRESAATCGGTWTR